MPARVLFDDSEDPAQFSDANLSKYGQSYIDIIDSMSETHNSDAIVLLLTTGESMYISRGQILALNFST
jgi:hypothetical protein